ncbi:MAG: hypothetical protein IJU76_04900 [Desulfovibrionaceae bacterium]|nr:hypothetical protein [Desulfovibrionaceae bacterium]
MTNKKHSYVSDEDSSALDEDLLDDDESVDDEDEVDEDDDDDFLSENSYTSDVDDGNPVGNVCDMPEDEVARYNKQSKK